MDPIALGSHLLMQGENPKYKTKRAEEMLKDGCREGMLCRIPSKTYTFVVPEVGYLLAAVAVGDSEYILSNFDWPGGVKIQL